MLHVCFKRYSIPLVVFNIYLLLSGLPSYIDEKWIYEKNIASWKRKSNFYLQMNLLLSLTFQLNSTQVLLNSSWYDASKRLFSIYDLRRIHFISHSSKTTVLLPKTPTSQSNQLKLIFCLCGLDWVARSLLCAIRHHIISKSVCWLGCYARIIEVGGENGQKVKMWQKRGIDIKSLFMCEW